MDTPLHKPQQVDKETSYSWNDSIHTPVDCFCPGTTAIQMNQVVHSVHVNKYNILNGGQLLKWVDTCACLSAESLAGRPCVTVSVDDLYFEQEVNLGQVLTLKAQVNRAFNTSMEVGVKVTCEDFDGDKEVKPVCEAYMTFVAISSNGEKIQLPSLYCLTATEKLCFTLASERKKVRVSATKTLKNLLHNYEASPSRQCSTAPCNTLDNCVISTVEGVNTRVESVELVLPPHANHHGNTFGGQIMVWMENVASISAGRLCCGISTLRSVDMVYFRGPSTVGDRIVLYSIVNNVFQNSLEVGVRVEAYRYENGVIEPRRHINSAFLTYDIRNSPTVKSLPNFNPEPVDGIRRQREATARRKMRLDRRYILSQRRQDQLSVPWSTANAMYLCYGNVQSLVRLAASNNWQMVSRTDTILLQTREEEGILSFCVTMKMKHDYKAEKIFQFLRNPVKRSEWDPLMISCKVVKEVGDEDAICHSIMHSSDDDSSLNDFVLLISDRCPCSDSEPYRIAIRSVTLDEVPPVDSYSRTEVACAGFIISQQCGLCTEISYYNETNPKLVSYVTCDVAGLSSLHCHVFQCMQDYFAQQSSDLK